MTAENQITILKALEAINLLSKTTSTNVLLNPESSINKLIANVITIKYKLSIIEGIINQTA